MKRWNALFVAALVAAVILSFFGYKRVSERIFETGTKALTEVLTELRSSLEKDLSIALSQINSLILETPEGTQTELRYWMQHLLDKLGAADVYCVLPNGESVYTYELPFALPPIDERSEDWYQRAKEMKPGSIVIFSWKDVRGRYVVDLAFRVRDLVFRVSEYPLKSFSEKLANDKIRLTLAALSSKENVKSAVVLASNVYKSGAGIEISQMTPVNLEDVGFLEGKPAIVGELEPSWIAQKRQGIRAFWTNLGLGMVIGILVLWIFIFFRRYRLILRSPLSLTIAQQALSSTVAIFTALIMLSLLVFMLGRSPFEAIKEMIAWAFFTRAGIIETLTRSVPVTLIATGLCVTFEAGMWNIGGEGQFILGAIATTGFSVLLLKDWPSLAVLIVTLIVAALAGALWALGPALMKVKLGVNEILSTLMLNYVALKLLDYLVYGPWKSAKVKNFPLTDPVPVTLGKIKALNVHWGVLSIPIVVLIVWFLMRKAVFGFEWKATGLGFEAARQSGVPVQKSQVLALSLSGAVAGLAGAIHMFGAQYVLQHGFSPGYGYTAIIVAFISNLNPIAVLFAGPLITGLFVGNARLELTMGFPVSVSFLVQGIILVSVILIRNLFLHRPKFVKRGGT
ncbi:MAG: hypothetical protein J7J80_06385 [Thermotogae bacterium]|nr:hypothetical protein [Thermotogota bacterium]